MAILFLGNGCVSDVRCLLNFFSLQRAEYVRVKKNQLKINFQSYKINNFVLQISTDPEE